MSEEIKKPETETPEEQNNILGRPWRRRVHPDIYFAHREPEKKIENGEQSWSPRGDVQLR